MCSYNAVNGEPSCASPTLLQGMLRQGLGFDGYVVSDCNAVAALTWGHKMAGNNAEAAAASVKAGVDMLCDKPDLVSWSTVPWLCPKSLWLCQKLRCMIGGWEKLRDACSIGRVRMPCCEACRVRSARRQKVPIASSQSP
jgi:hypothetical protein